MHRTGLTAGEDGRQPLAGPGPTARGGSGGRPWAIGHPTRRFGVAIGAVALGAGLLGACGSSATAAAPPACQKVSAALSDGPDPDADPVGYAQAQILPLRQIHTSDHTLQMAIDRLSTAYQAFVTAGGDRGAKKGVTAAASAVDAICPGATS